MLHFLNVKANIFLGTDLAQGVEVKINPFSCVEE
jgi:hypothetical protein